MDNRQGMRIAPPQPKVVWKTVAVTGDDPLTFARALESALQEMTDSGFDLVGQHTRGDAVILTLRKIESPFNTQPLDQPTPQPQPAQRRPGGRIVAHPLPPPPHVVEEVVYFFREKEHDKSLVFPSMPEALRIVKEHLAKDDVLPVRLVVSNIVYFEPVAIPHLLRTFASNLAQIPDKPLE
jgi:hypothetical protein